GPRSPAGAPPVRTAPRNGDDPCVERLEAKVDALATTVDQLSERLREAARSIEDLQNQVERLRRELGDG
ncbi:MAG: hypothetical protein ACRDD1_04660, partial [Planctomycetia bacterium]